MYYCNPRISLFLKGYRRQISRRFDLIHPQRIAEIGLGKLSSDSSGTLPVPWCSYFYNLEHSRGDLVRWLYEGSNLLDMVNGALPQLIISAIYIAVNYQLTVMIQLQDWTRLALLKQPLRVSDPEPDSAQVSTYWLSLPYRYSIPFLISSVAFSWFCVSIAFLLPLHLVRL